MDRKDRIRLYKGSPRRAGVYRIRNTVRSKSLLGSSPDLHGIFNRHRFQLALGSHPVRTLQKDWKELGEGAFVFEILDEMKPSDEPGGNPAEDLAALMQLWREKLAEEGEAFYE